MHEISHVFLQSLWWSTEMENKEIVSVVGETYYCTSCNKQYDHKSSLVRHMQIHTGEFSFHCVKCKTGFNDSRDYKLHMDKHAGVQYKCDYCPKVFMLSRTRDSHVSLHTGIWRFPCNKCDRGFNQRTVYEKHSKMHL